MSLFFSLLPTDLHICILHGWINDQDNGYALLRALSALDVACSKAHQAAFRTLIGQLPPFGGLCQDATPKPVILLVTNYLHWLSTRNVPIRSLFLSNASPEVPNQHLHSVENIIWDGHQIITDASAVLAICPEVMHLDLGHCATISVSPDTASQVPKLSCGGTPSAHLMTAVLTVLGPQLHVLRMPNCELSELHVDFLCENCPLLQVVEFAVGDHGVDHFVLLVQRCQFLNELVLYSYGRAVLDANVIADLVTAPPHLKKFTLELLDIVDAFPLFIRARELRPDLECLSIGGWKYSAEAGILLQHNIHMSAV